MIVRDPKDNSTLYVLMPMRVLMALALHRGARPASRLAVRWSRSATLRGYATLRLETDPRPVVLAGPNGAGKTNLLEAISFLAPGRGLRRARLSEVDRNGAGPWSVIAQLARPRSAQRRRGDSAAHAREGERERRSVASTAAMPSTQAALAETVGVSGSPAMDRLFQGCRRAAAASSIAWS